MKKITFVFFIFLQLYFTKCNGQLAIDFPLKNMVFQRNAANEGKIIISGTFTKKSIDSVRVKLFPKRKNQGKETAWKKVNFDQNAGYFNGIAEAEGGWYILKVESYTKEIRTDSTQIENIGIGEVFVIAGQSNAAGQNGSEARSATDERVVACRGYEESPNSDPIFEFYQVIGENYIYPVGFSSWCWGELGDKLTQKLNVPILFFNTGLGLSSTAEWLNSISNNNTERERQDQPYSFLRKTLQHYARTLGFRAVLWHQGEAEAYLELQGIPVKSETYYERLKTVIEESRKQSSSNLPWVISRVGRMGDYVSENVKKAQNQLITDLPFTFAGPDTDTISARRVDGIHFSNKEGTNGLGELANAWNAALTPNFFQKSVPILPNFIQHPLDCNGKTLLKNYLRSNWQTNSKGIAVVEDDKATIYFSYYATQKTQIEQAPIIASTTPVICDGKNTKIFVTNNTGNYPLHWNNGNVQDTLLVTTESEINARFKSTDGCQESLPSATVSIKNSSSIQPISILTSLPPTLCEGDSIQLSTYAENAILWNTNQTQKDIWVNQEGKYFYYNIFSNGCKSALSDSIFVKIYTKPSAVSSLDFRPPATLLANSASNSTFQWFLYSEKLPFTTAEIPITQSGNYGVRTQVVYETKQGQLSCTSDEKNLFVELPLANEKDETSKIILFPNPSSEEQFVTLKSTEIANFNVRILQLNGKIVNEMGLWKTTSTLKLPKLQAGNYLIQLENTEKKHIITKKMIVLE
jgi:Carbohydrate esterase, sialic acid-specific acetylesterase/Secretion system C-terminal sorting domain